MTYSKDKDNDANERNFSGIQPEDFNDLDLNYGYSNRDQRWKGVVNGVWQSPYWGLGLSGSFRYSTGSPYTALAGRDLNNDGISGTDRPTVNGEHFDRNSFRQPSFYELSLRLSKGFKVWEGNLQVFAECFNCTNAANRFVSGANQIYGANPALGRQPDAERQLRHRGRRGHAAHDPARPPVRLLKEARPVPSKGERKLPLFVGGGFSSGATPGR